MFWNPSGRPFFCYRFTSLCKSIPASALYGLSRSWAGMAGYACNIIYMFAVQDFTIVKALMGLFLVTFDAGKGSLHCVLCCINGISLGKLVIAMGI